MGVYAGPEITSDGLVLALDAGNLKGFDDDENLMTNSQLGTTILNDGGGVTLTTDTTIVNPFEVYDGVLKCVHTTQTPGYFRRGQLMSLTAGVTYTFSVFFKNGTVANPYGQPATNVIGLLATSGVGGGTGPTFENIERSLDTNIPFPNGWYRQVFTFTPAYTQTYQVDFNQTVNQTPLGTYYLYGFQLERGSSASPYYPTTASAKNRGTTLIDMTGRGNSGTLTNGPIYSSANGGSLVFDGADDYVLGTIPSSTFSGAHSIGCWFYRKTVTQWSGLFSTNVGTTSCPILTFIDSTNIIGTNQAGVNGAYVGIDLGADHLYKWIYCVMTVSGSTNGSAVNVYAYKDGSLLTATGSLYWTLSSSSSYYVGRHYQGGSQIHNGNISQVSIYNRALSAAEIQQNYNATKSRFTSDGSLSSPFLSPVQAQSLGYAAGTYYFRSSLMSAPQLLEYQPNYYESRPFCCVFRSAYASTATTNKIDLSIPMGGLLVQRDTLDLRGAVYWSTPITYNTVGGAGNNTADSGTGYAGSNARRVILGNGGGHGLYNTGQSSCSWSTAAGAIGAGYDGASCGSFPNGLIWGTGNGSSSAYDNRSGTWSHWITWN